MFRPRGRGVGVRRWIRILQSLASSRLLLAKLNHEIIERHVEAAERQLEGQE